MCSFVTRTSFILAESKLTTTKQYGVLYQQGIFYQILGYGGAKSAGKSNVIAQAEMYYK